MKPKVLIVDDVKKDRQKLREVLEKDFLLEEAASAEETFKKLQSIADIDVILLDIYMPKDEEVGLGALRRIKKLHPGIKVIMVTIEERIHKAIEYLQSGAFNFVTKPFDKNILLRLVNQAAGRKFKSGK